MGEGCERDLLDFIGEKTQMSEYTVVRIRTEDSVNRSSDVS